MFAGAILALGAAVTFAFSNATFRRGALGGSVAQAMAISLALGMVIALLAVTVTGGWATLFCLPADAIGALALAGILHFGWGRYCNFRATKAMGANLVAPIQQSSVILSLVLAVLVLGEILTPLRLLGIALIMVAPAISLRSGRARAEEESPSAKTFKPDLVQGYIFALLSATGFGSSPFLIRYSLQDAGVTASIAGWLIAYCAASLALLPVLAMSGRKREIFSTAPGPANWFAASGLLVGASQMFGFIALGLAPVSVVTPIQRLSLVIRVFANSLINRQYEVIGPRIWAATGVAMLGVLALTISTEMVLAVLPFSETVENAFRWTWP